MSEQIDYSPLPLTKFMATTNPTQSIVGARIGDGYFNSTTGETFTHHSGAFGDQEWRGDGGTVIDDGISSPDHSDLYQFNTMDNISGGILNDETTNGNTMTIVGAVQAAGHIGSNSLRFDGINDYALRELDVGDQIQEFCVCGWVKSTDSTGVLWSAQPLGAYADGKGWAVWLTGGVLQVRIGTSAVPSWRTVTAAATVNDGSWHFVVFNWETGEGNLYVDGVADGNFSSVEVIEWTDSGFAPSPATLYFGAERSDAIPSNNTPNVQFLDGDLDQFRYFTRILTTDEITTLYNGGTGK